MNVSSPLALPYRGLLSCRLPGIHNGLKETLVRVHWKKTCTLAALPVLISVCIAGFTAGSANASATHCNTNTAWTKICLTVIGSGAYISYATATMTSYNYPAGTDGHVQMINPNGSTLCNSPTRFFGALGESESCTWTLNAETLTRK